MSLGFLILAYVFGTVSGLVFGRLFCDWHHKNDVVDSSCCKQSTIGEQIENNSCSPGCCGEPQDKK